MMGQISYRQAKKPYKSRTVRMLTIILTVNKLYGVLKFR